MDANAEHAITTVNTLLRVLRFLDGLLTAIEEQVSQLNWPKANLVS